ncbi:MAG: hypothetical protein Q8M99_08185 [Methylotenera sp.]|nr:hypothetical protein [Methylotenera sp.]
MLENLCAVIEKAEASSSSGLIIAQTKTNGNFVACTYILALKDEVLRVI